MPAGTPWQAPPGRSIAGLPVGRGAGRLPGFTWAPAGLQTGSSRSSARAILGTGVISEAVANLEPAAQRHAGEREREDKAVSEAMPPARGAQRARALDAQSCF